MSESSAPTAADVRAMLRLSHVLHTSADPVARKRQLLSGLCELLGAGSAMDVVAHAEPARRRHTVVSITRHGPARLREDELLAGCLPALGRVRHRLPDATGWMRLGWPARPARGRRIRHCLWRPAPVSDARVVACVALARPHYDARPFTAREQALLNVAHLEMSWVYQADLLLASHGAASLSPRQRQTLQHLLAGHGEKQIAEHLRLSTNTVHHHVKALYRHFGVSSRSELLAQWLK